MNRKRLWPASWQQPSMVLVAVGGLLTVVFCVGIVRELLRGHDVRTQVTRLQQQVATEQKQQNQLQDLIEYLGSPTFQEREARLQLGLKKNGERVIIVPNANETPVGIDAGNSSVTAGPDAPLRSIPQSWWDYFFAARSHSST